MSYNYRIKKLTQRNESGIDALCNELFFDAVKEMIEIRQEKKIVHPCKSCKHRCKTRDKIKFWKSRKKYMKDIVDNLPNIVSLCHKNVNQCYKLLSFWQNYIRYVINLRYIFDDFRQDIISANSISEHYKINIVWLREKLLKSWGLHAKNSKN